MAFGGDDDQMVKRKHDIAREKQPYHRGRGAAGNRQQ